MTHDARSEMLFITQYYRPELVGSAPFCGDLAEWFADQWKTTVLTGLPNYPDGEVFASHRRGERRREHIDGVSVERLPIWVPKTRSTGARIASEIWFFLLGLLALLSRRVKRQRLVLSLSPSILSVALGCLARRRGGRHVALVHDIQSGLAQGLRMVRASSLLRVMRYAERKILSRADLVVVLTDEMKSYLRQIGVTAAIEVVPIWADIDRIEPAVERETDPVRLVYSGSFGRKQKVEQIAAIAADLQRRASGIEILLRGRGKDFEALRAAIDGQALRNVRFSDLVPAEDLFAGASRSDIHLVVHDPVAAKFAIPSKIYNILAAGLPCVAQAHPDTALWRLQQQSRGFLCVRPGDANDLTNAALRLAEAPALRAELGANGRRFIERNCAKSAVLPELLTTIGKLLQRTGRPQRAGVLIFEPEAEGHTEEWLRHLIRYSTTTAPNPLLWIVVPPALYEGLVLELRDFKKDRVRLLSLTQAEADLCRHRWLPLCSFARWWIARRYVARTQATALHFLSLDLLSLPLALGLPFKARLISGVLFRPSSHYRLLGCYDPTLRERLRDRRKEFLYRLMLSRRSLRAALTIDPYFARYAARFYRQGKKIHALPDPVAQADSACAESIDLAAQLPRERVVFLLFGYLTERKGTLRLLDALCLLPGEIGSRAAVILAGKVDPAIRDAVQSKLNTLRSTRPTLLCHLEDRRLEVAEIEALVRRADVVLAPYQRFVGSSGVMLWAARLGKPLLTQDFGTLGALVRDHRLGVAVDCTKHFLLADTIADLVKRDARNFIDRAAAREFVADHAPDKFAESILTSVAA